MGPFRQTPYRPAPLMPAAAYKTFQIASPISTHYRPATCEEVGCLAQAHGWATMVDESHVLGAKQAHYIRKLAGRSFIEARTELGLTRFEFAAGQRCFASESHRVPLERPEIYVVREGDHRGNPRGTEPRVHVRALDWVDEFANHQDKIATAIGQG